VFPSPDRLLPVKGPNGKPLRAVKIELNCQPPTTLSQNVVIPLRKGLLLPNGNSYQMTALFKREPAHCCEYQ
jgi:hypothetical protein